MRNNRNKVKGFSLVELLAVVLILAVLAAVAIPLYSSQKQSAAARACKANIAAIATACTAYSLRIGAYPATLAIASSSWTGAAAGGVVGAPEGLAAWPTCPLGQSYTYSVTSGAATIGCPNSATHITYFGVAADYTKVLTAPAADSLP